MIQTRHNDCADAFPGAAGIVADQARMVESAGWSPLVQARGRLVHEIDPTAIAFGRTVVAPITGELFDQPVQVIICPANTRGIMPASGAASPRLAAGAEIERQTMSMAPLQLGSAVATPAGKLAERGVERLMHAIVSEDPGGAASLDDIRRALAAALELVHTHRLHSVAVPLLGIAAGDAPDRRRQGIEAIVDVIVADIRRDRSTLDRVVIVSRYPDERDVLAEALAEARARSWRA
jgi:O-acetyl-ADP-ribose deacetylase (regulator of RNase III)